MDDVCGSINHIHVFAKCSCAAGLLPVPALLLLFSHKQTSRGATKQGHSRTKSATTNSQMKIHMLMLAFIHRLRDSTA